MILRHPNCEITDCKTCLEDHEKLEEVLRSRTKVNSVDHLGKYRTFMDKRLRKSSETKWGWAVPEIFKEIHIEAYIKSWKEQQK
jgi:hypothetical protein